MTDLEHRLYEWLAHGDEDHRAWLREAIRAFFSGAPRPAERPHERSVSAMTAKPKVFDPVDHIETIEDIRAYAEVWLEHWGTDGCDLRSAQADLEILLHAVKCLRKEAK